MTHSPPVPEGNTSPYPIQEPPHEKPTANLPIAVDDDEEEDRGTSLLLPIAATVTAGVAAIAAGLALWRGSQTKPARRKRKKKG